MLYGAYRIGALLLGTEAQAPALHLNLEGWLSELAQIWQPLLLGSLICGFAAGSLGYALVKLVWRLTVMRQWHRRQLLRREKGLQGAEDENQLQQEPAADGTGNDPSSGTPA